MRLTYEERQLALLALRMIRAKQPDCLHLSDETIERINALTEKIANNLKEKP
jgi:hypothetical protein